MWQFFGQKVLMVKRTTTKANFVLLILGQNNCAALLDEFEGLPKKTFPESTGILIMKNPNDPIRENFLALFAVEMASKFSWVGLQEQPKDTSCVIPFLILATNPRTAPFKQWECVALPDYPKLFPDKK